MDAQKSLSNFVFVSKIFAASFVFSTFVGCGGGSSSSTAEAHSVNVTVTGLYSAQQVKLENNLVDSITVNADGFNTFPTFVLSGARYDVKVATQPSSDKFMGCSVPNGSGAVENVDINISVVCGPVVSTFAGSGVSGSRDGLGTDASFSGPRGMVFDSQGNLYVADYQTSVIRKIDANGNVTTFAGSGSWGYVEGQGITASFRSPIDIAIDANDNLYVTDSANNSIRKIDVNGNVTTLARISYPTGIALGPDGNLYIARYSDHVISKMDMNGVAQVFAGSGAVGNHDGQGTSASFDSPYDLIFDSLGNLFVSDLKARVIRKITPTANVTTFAGSGVAGNTDGQGTAASFNGLGGLTIDSQDNIYLADNLNYSIRRIDANANVITFVGIPGTTGAIDGRRDVATFNRPMGIVLNKGGDTLFVSDYFNYRIRKISQGAQ